MPLFRPDCQVAYLCTETLASLHLFFTNNPFFVVLLSMYNNRQRMPTAVRAEDVDYEAQFKKLQSEAEDRLDEKVEELMKNIETVGQN